MLCEKALRAKENGVVHFHFVIGINRFEAPPFHTGSGGVLLSLSPSAEAERERSILFI